MSAATTTDADHQNQITDVTRRQLLDALSLGSVHWAGRLEDIAFLDRLYDLDNLPSQDFRFETARQDIVQHCVSNNDWDHDWVFHDVRFELSRGPDDVLLRFLAETLHPVVRPSGPITEELLQQFNEALAPDGYELVVKGRVSGRPTYEGRPRTAYHGNRPTLGIGHRPLLTDRRVLHEHLERIGENVHKDPTAAIGSAKELVESLCKIILDLTGETYPAGDDLPALYRRVADLLRLRAESVPASAKGSEATQKMLRTVTTTVQCLAELRNELGLGHGRSAPSPALTRHARLALNSTVAVAEFLLDTWEQRLKDGEVTVVSP